MTLSRAEIAFPFTRRGDVIPPECAQLRENAPIARVRTIAGDSAWLVSTHELCRQVLEDERFSLQQTSAEGAPRQYALTIPPHVTDNMGNINSAGLRNAVMKALRPSEAVTARMRERADALLDGIVREGPPVDLHHAFSEPYSAQVMCDVLGLPEAEWRRLMSSVDIAFVTSPVPFEGAEVTWYKDQQLIGELLRSGPTSGLLARFAQLRGTEGLTDEALTTVVQAMFGAGAVSTTAFLLHAALQLVQRPGLVAELRERPELLGRAVDELLRWTTSIGDGLPRVATEDVELGDVLVRRGELVLVLVEGANHDPAVFADPERVDPGRSPNPHLAFGTGPHTCPASALGRAHAEVGLGRLLERLPGLRPAVPVETLVWRTGFIKRVPERLPVLW